MCKRLIKIFVLASLSMAGAVHVANAVERPTKWHTFRSPDYGFTIDYPSTMAFESGRPVMPSEMSMFPICDNTTVACFRYNGDALEHSIFQAIGLSVNVLRDLKTEAECNTIDDVSQPIKTITIHGNRFHYGDWGEAGGGSSRSVTDYRTFYRNVCFEVAVVSAQSDISPVEYADEGIEPIKRSALRRINRDMDRMLRSFAFVAPPVADGADWDVYADSGCGGEFEYPSNATLRKVIEYSNAAYDSPDITCEQAFAYLGRDYTVAAKVNLRNKQALDAWLSLRGLPKPGSMKVVAHSDRFTEYRDQMYTYVYSGNNVFIFSVSDENHRVVSAEGDKVFTHLVESFRVN